MSNAYRLLICDDDEILRDTLTEQLDLCDTFTVFSESCAADAIGRISGERIDLAVMDFGLTDMDGR